MEEHIQLDMKCMPSHVAIIMDGNGRWAKQRGMERTFGHQAGAETVHQIVEEAARLGIKYLTLYTFSTENWNRPTEEITALMGLLFEHIEEETFMKNNVSFNICIGNNGRVYINNSDNNVLIISSIYKIILKCLEKENVVFSQEEITQFLVDSLQYKIS